jgi:O-6-methylguanine DNA methyltransferase
VTEFEKKVYEFLLTIPSGKVVTYGQIGYAIGHPRAARAVGNALHRNPDGDLYPCYKVVAASGALAADFVFGGAEAQAARLEADGIEVVNGFVDMDKYQW